MSFELEVMSGKTSQQLLFNLATMEWQIRERNTPIFNVLADIKFWNLKLFYNIHEYW